MLGLIEKDLRLTFARKQILLIFFIMALIMGILMDGSFTVGYLTMLATIISIKTISFDEYDNGFAFLMTLPFDRKTYVREKYLFCLMMSAAAWCIGAVLYFIGNTVRRSEVNLIEELPMLIALIPVMYLSSVIMIPIQLKYGSEKSNIALSIFFCCIAVLFFGTKAFFSGRSNPVTELIRTIENLSPAVVLLAIIAVCALASGISYMLSIRIMKKKEF